MNPQAKLSICLFSDANFLAVNILENLLSKNCIVKVVTEDANDWKDKTSKLAIKTTLNIVDRKNFDPGKHYNYAVFCGGFINRDEAYADYTDFCSLPYITEAKTLILFPFEVFDRNRIDKIKVSNNSAVLFVGDLLGPRIDLDSDLLMPRALSEILWKRELSLAVGETFFPIFVPDIARVIVKWLFSFGPYGRIVFLLGSQTSGDTFWSKNQKLVGGAGP